MRLESEIMKVEAYAETSNGLFPRFILASALFAALNFAILQVFTQPLRSQASPGIAGIDTQLQFIDKLYEVSQVAYIPFLLFALFYLTFRVRIFLDRDYAALALSVFLGCFAVQLGLQAFESISGEAIAGSGYTFLWGT